MTLCLFIVGALGSAVTFLVPLYIQVVQGRSGLQTAVAVIPYSLSSFVAAVLVVRLFDRVSPQRIARLCVPRLVGRRCIARSRHPK